MKLDKETVVKHQFWFLLGGYTLIWLIAILCLWLSAPGKIDAAKSAYKKAEDGVKEARKKPINRTTFLPPWDQEAKTLDGHKRVIWKDAWDWQAGMYSWPEYLAKNYNMTSPETPISTDDLNKYRHELYPQEIDDLRKNAPRMLEPVELQGGFDSVFKPRTKDEWHETPTREEIWLAQEDFWVKRELFWDVYMCMSGQALMVPQPIEEKKEPNPDPEHIKARYRFANKNWEITLNIRANAKGTLVIGGDSTIKNIHASGHPQPLTSGKGKGVWFNVVQDNTRTLFEVRGEPVSSGEARPFSMEKDQERSDYPPLEGITWDPEKLKEHPIYVSQGFDQTNSPIRRINAIELGQQDCRTFVWSLQPNHVLAELDAVPEDPNKPQEAPAGGAGAPGMGGAGMPGMGGGGDTADKMKAQMQMMQNMGGGRMPGMGGGQGQSAGNPTPNNQLERNRYLQSKEQDKKLNPPSRHLPLAIQVIAEQSHLNDFLVAMANSRLRFQITQAEFRHVKDYQPQTESEKKGEKDTTGMSGLFMGPTPGIGAGSMQQRMMQQQMMMQKQMMSGGMMGGPNASMKQQMQQQMQQQMKMQQQMMGGMGGMGGGGPMGGFGPMMGSPIINNKPTFAPGLGRGTLLTATDTKQSAQNQQDDNLVELTVYGIATLYRFPDQPKTTEQQAQGAEQAPQPAQQPSGTATPPASGTATPTTNTAQPPAGTTTTQDGSKQPETPKPVSDPAKPADAKQPDKPAEKKPADKQPAAPKTTPPAGEKR